MYLTVCYFMPRTSFRVNPNFDRNLNLNHTIRALKLVRHMIVTYSIHGLSGNIFVCYLKASIFHSSILIKMLKEKKKFIYIFYYEAQIKSRGLQEINWGKPKIITKCPYYFYLLMQKHEQFVYPRLLKCGVFLAVF